MELTKSSGVSKKIPKLSMQEVLDNQETLKRINRKIDFHKNPRYQNVTSHKYTDTLKSNNMTLAKDNVGAFRCEPPEIVFSNFQKDMIYEFQITLVNTSKLLRRIKVTPIASEDFVVSGIKYPNENSGDIASGMKVKINVRFLPKQIKSYQSQLIILSEDSVLKVPIYTVREEPQLQIPDEINCGSCQTGNKLEVTQNIKNIGGDADFSLSSTNSEVIDGRLYVGDFTIQPSSFKLKKGETVQFKVKYNSTTEKRSVQKINILSQYLLGKEVKFDVVGESFKPHIQLHNLNDSKLIQNTRLQKIYFENVIPNQEYKYSIGIKNLADLELQYNWSINNPNFTISEPSGIFKPHELKQFIIKYNSNSYIPNFAQAKIYIGQNTQNKFAQYQFKIITEPDSYKIDVSPEYYIFPHHLVYQTWYEKQVTLTNHSPAEVSYSILQRSITDNTLSENQSKSIENLLANQTKTIKFKMMIPEHDDIEHKVVYEIKAQNSQPLFFQMCGWSIQPEISVSEKMDFGLVKINSEAKSSITLHNPNKIPLQVKIQNNNKYYLPQYYQFYDYDEQDLVNLDKKLWIQKQEFTLEPLSTMTLSCVYFTKLPESRSQQILIKVQNGKSSIVEFHIQVQEIHLLLSSSYFNLKQLFVNNKYTLKEIVKKHSFSLMNLGNIQSKFCWVDTETRQCKFQFYPKEGIIMAKSKIQFSVIITPLRNCKLNHKAVCKNDAEDVTVCFQGSIRGLQIKYYMVNQALAKRIIVKESLDLSKTDRSMKNLNLSLTSSISHLKQKQKVIYPELSSVDFFNGQINIPKQVEIILQNHSDLDTEFQLKALKYGVKKQQQTKQKQVVLGKTLPFSSQMGTAFIAKRQLEKSQKQYLKDSNHGVTIICEPDKGKLSRGTEVKIMLTLFNNICGRFTDILEIKTKDHQTKQFPIDIDIKGTPVGISRNQLGINFNTFFPTYKFGSFPTNSGTVRKEFKVINKGPRPVQLVWNIYSIDKPLNKDPFKISIQPPSLGSNNPVSVKWLAVEPEPQQNSLFTIEPKSKTIQPQQETSFTITYSTLSEPQNSRSIFIGQPYLVNEALQKVKMQLMTIIAEAQTVKPELRIDRYVSNLSNDNILVFQKYAGQQSGKDIKSILLQNPTQSNLICSFQIDNPSFKIIHTHTNSTVNSLLSKTQNQLTKTLKGSFGGANLIESCFNISPGSFVQLKIKFDSDCKNTENWGQNPKIRKQAKLLVSYSNGDTQIVDLLGELKRPILALNTTGKQGVAAQQIIDFGVVHIKNDKKKTMYLANISPVKGKWSLKYVKFPTKRKFEQALWTKLDQEDILITDQKQCFNFSISQGSVESMTIPIKTMPNTLALPAPDDQYAKTHIAQKIMISFKPKKDVLYKSKFKILVENGEAIQFILRGMGTYQEEYQK